MAEEKTYLELSEDNSHKFYEVIVRGVEVSIRYGRIGDQGQTKVTKFPTSDKAKADADKKISEKIKKGYERAVIGVRKKRTVTRRRMAIASATQGSAKSGRNKKLSKAPILWNFATGDDALGIFVDESHCWVGNEAGKIFSLDHDGKVHSKFKLPEGVKCIVSDGNWLYAGCDDGNVYDLSGKVPRIAYEISEDVNIFWIDIHDAILAVSDEKGCLTTINHEDESQWVKKSSGKDGWMVRCDEIGIYMYLSWPYQRCFDV
jgi:predicted DNA-binding WGR domain protein